jgi:hypothetical protein
VSLNRVIRWRAIDQWPGLEHAHIADHGDAITVRSALIGENDDHRFGVHYELQVDPGWVVRQAFFQRIDGATFALRSDGRGNWTEGDGTPRPDLAGCIDIDISRTPVTNTLPMRRARWEPDVPRRFEMAWVALDTFAVRRDGQIYTWLGGDRWRYQAADGSFEAVLVVDEDRLVVSYEGLFERVE